ncbi:FAD-dependent oxidoreductase [Glycomyces sp. TRM65418]|uniref:NAD(P)/FAD-dependent oxidoreductase n=1 Tax=Glycomyces sp. TRM65418 TaxID=2867006 RepID=UPI001D166BBC|nr:FAD-dependent oxidoreductase [Glycomyces sp. TRM65418]MCC3765279.1 FAD-dependent oxidoreductase [Glycomyces sp. TRM65418]
MPSSEGRVVRIDAADVVVIGAGIIGAACAEALSAAGLRVLVLDRGAPAGGTTAGGEGNVLVSDKAPGPELDLAVASRRRWPELLESLRGELGDELVQVEWEPKGGLVVATDEDAVGPLRILAEAQREAGVEAVDTTAEAARAMEPHLAEDVHAAVHYPEDAQLQPVLATTALLAAVRARGGEVRGGTEVHGLVLDAAGTVGGVRLGDGTVSCGAVVNACGPWAGHFSVTVGAPIEVLPRRGAVLVTAPLPPVVVRRKVYAADYAAAVATPHVDLQVSAVVESTATGAVLIGSSRQRVGFDESLEVEVLRRLARSAIRLFPVLAGVPVMRTYGGFRPYTPDHLPVIGEDPRFPGLWHASGHEGAGIGLAPATGRLVADLMCGRQPEVDPFRFRVDRPEVIAEVRT